MITKEQLYSICMQQYEPNGLLDTIQSKGNAKIGTDIGAISEAFNIVSDLLLTNDELFTFDQSVLVSSSIKPGVYLLENNKVLAVLEFEPNELQYTAHWLANSINTSQHLKQLKGSFLFFLEPLSDVYIPHIYSYIIPDNLITNLFPVLSLHYLEDDREGIEWVDDAMDYFEKNTTIKVDREKYNYDPIAKV